jgi:hypothetical protein
MQINLQARLRDIEQRAAFRAANGLPALDRAAEYRRLRALLAMERERDFEAYLDAHRELHDRVLRRVLHRAGTVQPGWIYGWSLLLQVRGLFWKRFKLHSPRRTFEKS